MHSFQHGRFVFNFNSDMSGDVYVSEHEAKGSDGWERRIAEMKIPAEAILAFVARYVQLEKITKLEKASVEEILGIDRVNR